MYGDGPDRAQLDSHQLPGASHDRPNAGGKLRCVWSNLSQQLHDDNLRQSRANKLRQPTGRFVFAANRHGGQWLDLYYLPGTRVGECERAGTDLHSGSR